MDQILSDGDKSAAQDNHKTLDWHHVWKSVEDAGTHAGNAIKSQVNQIDTKDLSDRAKHAASQGLKLVRGESDNRQANEISDAANKYLPGMGLIRKGAEIAHESGAEGKVLEGKKGPLHAPSDKTLRGTAKEAIGTAIPIPGGGRLVNELLNRTGSTDKLIDAAFDSTKKTRDH